jgi:hypothetical protein
MRFGSRVSALFERARSHGASRADDEPGAAETRSNGAVAVATVPAPPPPREWNLWELERRARDHAGDTARDEEWSALFVNLRIFANTEGLLPTEFDGLVRESFAELIRAA